MRKAPKTASGPYWSGRYWDRTRTIALGRTRSVRDARQVAGSIRKCVRPRKQLRGLTGVGGTGIEPATSSVSGKRATAAPTARVSYCDEWVLLEVATGFEPVWTALQAAASPLGHATMVGSHTLLTSQRETSLERMTRFELATPTLARLCATTAPHPHTHISACSVTLYESWSVSQTPGRVCRTALE